jgi:hypothetical protein
MPLLDLRGARALHWQDQAQQELWHQGERLWPHRPALVCPLVQTPPTLGALYAVVQDVSHGCLLYEKSATSTWTDSPASLVKLMTGLLLLTHKSASLDSETITLDATDINQGGVAPALQLGDVMTWRAALTYMLAPSSNDAAYAIGRHLGNYLYAQAGSTGTQGRTRCLEAMNALAVSLGASGLTFTNVAYGVIGSLREFRKVVGAAYDNAILRGICGAASATVQVTGTNVRSLDAANSDRMVNGPWQTPAGHTQEGLLAGKIGNTSIPTYAEASRWVTPNGTLIDILIAGVSGDGGDWPRYCDVYALYYAALQNYPHLTAGAAPPVDAQAAQVRLLANWDSGLLDRSAIGHPLTASGGLVPTVGGKITGNHALSFDGSDDLVSTPDAATLEPGAEDFCLEVWLRGGGTTGGWRSLVVKADHYTPNYGYGLLQNGTTLAGYVTTGTSTLIFPQASVGAYFWNGAPRHLALVRQGTSLRVYANGESLTTLTASIGAGVPVRDTSLPLTLGACRNGGGYAEFFNGTIDNVRLTIGHHRYSGSRFSVDPRGFPIG